MISENTSINGGGELVMMYGPENNRVEVNLGMINKDVSSNGKHYATIQNEELLRLIT